MTFTQLPSGCFLNYSSWNQETWRIFVERFGSAFRTKPAMA